MTDEELIREFRRMAKAGPGGDRPWISFHIVVTDGRTIRAGLDDKTILHRLKVGKGAIGFMGITIFGDPHKAKRAPSLQVFYKPLKAGVDVIEKLDEAGRTVTAAVILGLKLEDKAIDTEIR